MTLRCSAEGGRPSSTVTLKGTAGEQLATSETSVTQTLDVLECEDSGDYTCVASNAMGRDVFDTLTLTVQCEDQS